MRNKTVAALLALFFGSFGVHKFYLRDPGAGIFYIIIMLVTSRFSFPVAGILGIIDALVLFSMSQERFDSKYNQGREGPRYNRKNYSGRHRYERPIRNQNAPYTPKARRRNTRNPQTNFNTKNPFKTSGIKHLEEYELDLAEENLLKSLEISQEDREVHFALAQLYSVNEETDKAYFHLSKAFQLGYKNVNEVMENDKFAFLRIQKDFEKFKTNQFLYPPRRDGGFAEPSRTQSTTSTTQRAPKEDLLQNDLLLSQLNKLAELRNKGLLSESEFEEERIKLLQK